MKLKELLNGSVRTTHKIIKNNKEKILVNMKAGKYGYETFVKLTDSDIKKVIALGDEESYENEHKWNYTKDRSGVVTIIDNSTKSKTKPMTVLYNNFMHPIQETM